jgi:hypothetical protein
MKTPQTRREFLSEVGKGMLVTAVGAGVASELGLARALAADPPAPLTFGDLEPLVAFMQETPAARLVTGVVEKIKSGTELRQLVAAAALANARSFGGEDYVGFHTMMALAPAFHMAQEMPEAQRALPVLKVLYRNTNRIQEHGGRKSEVLCALPPVVTSEARGASTLADAVHGKDAAQAENAFAALAGGSVDAAFNELLHVVQENPEVHRVVLPYRAWDLLDMIGRDQALTLLRQSVRYCVAHESWAASRNEPRTLLPKLLEEHHLLDREPGVREADDAWVEELSLTFFTSTPQQAAAAAASALAEGFAPAAVGEALSLAANQLILRDHGRTPRDEVPGKPLGTVHGDSIGVHACDSANAWRNLARVANARNTFACLIIGAYQVAYDRTERGGDFQHWEPLPVAYHLNAVKTTDADGLLREADDAIRGNLQAHAAAIVARYGALDHPPRAVFDLLLRYAVSEDGALHAEKYYRTVSEEFAATRPAFRWRQLIALARVTASEYGRPAAGVAEARALLNA